MRAPIRALAVGLSVVTFSGCAGVHCLHRPCNPECAASFGSSRAPRATMKTGRPTWRERLRISRLWEPDESARDITVRPEATPIPGARLERRRPAAGGVLDLPPAVDAGEAD